jgi:hypothetical protein
MKTRKEYTKKWYGIKTLESMTFDDIYQICLEENLPRSVNQNKENLIETLDKNGFVKRFNRGRKAKEIKIEDLIKMIRIKIKNENLLDEYVKAGKLSIKI